MAWYWWIVVAILGINAVLFGGMFLIFLHDEWRHGRHE